MTAFDSLFEQHYRPLVRALAVAYDEESAADAVQEAFVEADRRWSQVSSYVEPAAWIRRVAINRLRNGQRNHRRRVEILATLRSRPVEEPDPVVLDLRRAVAGLPSAMRTAVCLHYLADLPVEDIADALGVAPGTVKSNLHDGRRRLRSALEGCHD